MDLESQNDELLVLSSIYEECFNCEDNEECKGGQLVIHFALSDQIPLIIDIGADECKDTIKLSHLPPLYLNFTYPKDYPSASPPNYTLSCKWITTLKLSQICTELDRIWDENKGDVILYLWSQYIKDSALKLLNIKDSIKLSETKPICDKIRVNNICKQRIGCDHLVLKQDNSEIYIDRRTIQDVGPHTNMFNLLRDYDIDSEQVEFNKKSFECKVCFANKGGTRCVKFWPCSHVYCKSCMKDYFEVQIKEGNVKSLKCPTEKCESEANPKQVEELVSNDLYERWDQLLLSSTLSSLADTQPCPRIHCQYPVTMEDNQGSCPSCAFVFCGLCRAGWHGVEQCKLNKTNLIEIMEWYTTGSEETQRKLELKYGKKQLEKLHSEYLSMNYLKDNAKKCPKCNSNIEKTEGCNKMTCKNCDTNFCWLCMKILNKANPYSHFNDVNGACANLLFEGVIDEDSDDEDFVFYLE